MRCGYQDYSGGYIVEERFHIDDLVMFQQHRIYRNSIQLLANYCYRRHTTHGNMVFLTDYICPTHNKTDVYCVQR